MSSLVHFWVHNCASRLVKYAHTQTEWQTFPFSSLTHRFSFYLSFPYYGGRTLVQLFNLNAYSHVEMDGSNTTDNDFDNERLLIRKDRELVCFWRARPTGSSIDELSVFIFCIWNVSRTAGFLWMERYHETTTPSCCPKREAERGHIAQS